jgi:hypothetical protein
LLAIFAAAAARLGGGDSGMVEMKQAEPVNRPACFDEFQETC